MNRGCLDIKWNQRKEKRIIEHTAAEELDPGAGGIVVALTNTAIKSHIVDFMKFTNFGEYPFLIYELDNEKYKQMKTNFRYYKKQYPDIVKKVELIHDDMFNIVDRKIDGTIKYIHADLCKSAMGVLQSDFVKKFTKLLNYKSLGRKWYFDFTTCTRGAGGSKTADILLNNVIPCCINSYGWTCEEKDYDIHRYTDGMTMMKGVYTIEMPESKYEKFVDPKRKGRMA